MEENDSYLLDQIHEGNEEARELLFKKYEPFIKNTAKRYVKSCENLGIDENDLAQEAMLTFINVIEKYSPDKDNLFFTYLRTAVENKLVSLIIKARRPKYNMPTVPLTSEEDDLDYLLKDYSYNPETYFMENEHITELQKKISDVLTPFEEQVLMLKINNFNYKEIAQILDKDTKSIDNTLQRIRNKAKKIVNR